MNITHQKTIKDYLNILEEKTLYEENLEEESLFEECSRWAGALDAIHDYISIEYPNGDFSDDSLVDIVELKMKQLNIPMSEFDEIFDAVCDDFCDDSYDDSYDDLYDENYESNESNESTTNNIKENIISQMTGLDSLKDYFTDYKQALKELDILIKLDLRKHGKLTKTLEYYAQKVDHKLKEKINPKKLSILYKKLNPVLSEEIEISPEFAEFVEVFLNSKESKAFLSAMKKDDKDKMEKILINYLEGDTKKAKEYLQIFLDQ